MSYSVFRSSKQQWKHSSPLFGEHGPFCHPGSHKLCAAAPGTCVHPACQVFVGWEMGHFYCAKSWNWPILTTVYHPGLPLEIVSCQQTPEFQNSYIRQILPVQLLSRWGDRFRFLLLPTLPSFQNPLHRELFEEHNIDPLLYRLSTMLRVLNSIWLCLKFAFFLSSLISSF